MEVKLLTVEETCHSLRISRSQLYKMLKTGEIPSLHIGKAVRIREQDLRDWITSKSTPAE